MRADEQAAIAAHLRSVAEAFDRFDPYGVGLRDAANVVLGMDVLAATAKSNLTAACIAHAEGQISAIDHVRRLILRERMTLEDLDRALVNERDFVNAGLKQIRRGYA